ncbi:PREDICTED: matrix metalloproteinase-20-like [Crocodylus porosus]|uniref:matrix metalloproteinase-20-like n=1 Tax=Crocodylus porosus TaxID=8502 RepID=UPI000938988C|nr:PREDICTED: matrix metalloproteinase-20-like [Crocodylus porosus]
MALQSEHGGTNQHDFMYAEKYPQQFYSMDPVSSRTAKRYIRAVSSKIKEIQGFFGFHVTGKLDTQTVAMMKKSRCGVSDVKKHEFYIKKPKWKGNTITYRIQNYTNKLKREEVEQVVEMSLKVWSDVTPLNFVRKHSGDADIMITFASKEHGDFFPFDGPRGILGHAYGPEEEAIGGDVHLDEDEFWTIGYVKKGYDLFSVVAHEFGHSLGLGHSKDPNALMYPKYKFFESKGFQLSHDDRTAIQSLYGAESKNSLGQGVPEKCDSSLTFDAVTSMGNSLLFIKDGYMWLRKYWVAGNVEGFHQNYFPEFQTKIDAAYEIPDRKTVCLFTALKYWIMNTLTMEISVHSIYDLGFFITVTHIDAAVYIKRKKKTFFFIGDEFWSFDEVLKMMEAGYPKKIQDGFPGINGTVNAAFEWAGFTYIFVDSDVYVYHLEEKKILFSIKANAWFRC